MELKTRFMELMDCYEKLLQTYKKCKAELGRCEGEVKRYEREAVELKEWIRSECKEKEDLNENYDECKKEMEKNVVESQEKIREVMRE